MAAEPMDAAAERFLTSLFEKTGGDPAKDASMYEIGASLGMDRSASLQTAEMLMGAEWIEVRSLSGAVGLTAEGVERAAALSAAEESSHEAGGNSAAHPCWTRTASRVWSASLAA